MGRHNAVSDIPEVRAIRPIDRERLNTKCHLGLPNFVQDSKQRPQDDEAEKPTDELVVAKEPKAMVHAADLQKKKKKGEKKQVKVKYFLSHRNSNGNVSNEIG
jgi:hypothetical protein